MQHIANMPGGCPGCAERDREIDRLERLRRFDTGSETLPPGVVLEHARLDGMWQKLVRERDKARNALAMIEGADLGEIDVKLIARVGRA